MTFAIHGIFEAIFRPGVVIIRPNSLVVTLGLLLHYALPGQKIALKSPRSGKRQQTLALKFTLFDDYSEQKEAQRGIHKPQ